MERRVADIKVSEVMSRNVICVSPNMNLIELHQLFQEKDFNAFPVMHNERLVGIVTKLDLMRIFTSGRGVSKAILLNSLSEKVEDIMTSAVVSVSPKDDLKAAVEYMVEYRLRSIPVVENRKVVGMLSRGDLMRHMTIV
jgi:CBS domain-containing protein